MRHEWKIFGVLRVAAGGDKRPFGQRAYSPLPFLFEATRSHSTPLVDGDRSDLCIVSLTGCFLLCLDGGTPFGLIRLINLRHRTCRDLPRYGRQRRARVLSPPVA